MKKEWLLYGIVIAWSLSMGLFSSQKLCAQDPQFSQFFMNPIYLNPALTGNTRLFRITMNTRRQWGNLTSGYVSNAVSIEGNFDANNSAFGLQLIQDKTGIMSLTYVGVGASYAYKAKLSRKLRLTMGLKMSLGQRYMDLSQLHLASDIAGSNENVIDQGFNNRVSYFDINAGMALISRTYWVGIAIDHLNRPNYALSSTTSPLPIKVSLHAQYQFKIKKSIKKVLLQSFVAGLNIKRQNEWNQMDIGGYYRYKDLMLGAYYRGLPFVKAINTTAVNQDAAILLVGYEWLGLKVVYSYDITVSKLATNTGGSHEFSLQTTYPFNPKRRRRSRRFIPCPKF